MMELGSLASSVTTGDATLEVRWILRGSSDPRLLEWIERFSFATETREDTYLVGPRLSGLSVKIRGNESLEVKVHGGGPDNLVIGGHAVGRLDLWQKWSFPLVMQSEPDSESASWERVRKMRRMVSFSGGGVQPPGRPITGSRTRECAIELTDFALGGESWWTLGFEASGPAEELRGAVESAAAFLLNDPTLERLVLLAQDSVTYSDWLGSRRVPAEGAIRDER